MLLDKLQREKREQILEIASKHGASNIRIFGSVARREETERSDIDILIDFNVEKITPWFPSGLMRELELLLERKIDITTIEGLKDTIKERVLQEAIDL